MTLVDDVRRQLTDRLNELRPLVEEYHQLEAMNHALRGGAGAPATPRRARSTSSGAGTRTAQSDGRRGRRRGTGTRAAEALELVKSRPGITIPDLADAMGIKQNYLYRVMPSLAQDGRVAREGKGWRATE